MWETPLFPSGRRNVMFTVCHFLFAAINEMDKKNALLV